MFTKKSVSQSLLTDLGPSSRSALWLLFIIGSIVLGTAYGVTKEWPQPEARVVEAQTSGGECCKRYDLKVHIPAEEWSPSLFVRQIQWKNTAAVPSNVPLQFSVEYCAGLNLEGPCSSYNGEITIDGVLQELGGSNGGTASWPVPYCGIDQGMCGENADHPCRLVELEKESRSHDVAGGGCGYDPPLRAHLPCFADTDHRLSIAEKIFQGQTKRFRRIFLFPHPDADPTSGNPPRLIQRWDPQDPNDPPWGVLCGPSVDRYVMLMRPWVAIYQFQFGPVASMSPPECWDEDCHLEYEFCFPYRFFALP